MTTETLRHYDRIGLFRPQYTDEETSYRYYSISQYERLGTIKELRQMGLSLEEIKEFFADRKLENSIRLLKKHREIIKAELDRQRKLLHILDDKLDFLQYTTTHSVTDTIAEEDIGARMILSFEEPVKNREQIGYDIMRLESCFDTIALVFATDRIGCCVSRSILMKGRKVSFFPAILVSKQDVKGKKNDAFKGKKPPGIRHIPPGHYVCVNYVAKFGEYSPIFEKVNEYLREKDYIIKGQLLQMYKVDVTLTDNFEETVMRLEIPVRPRR
jgi:DNA-binding transcriptional MerR regulator